jgi:DNA topoisomerase-1
LSAAAPRSGARLRYVVQGAGITRRRRGRGFEYRDARGRLVRDPATLARIRALAVPPAWREVWICPSPHGHLQATGFDARGRKQYRYHPEWRERREAHKFDRLREFGAALPGIRRRLRADLREPGLPRQRVLAALVALLDRTRARVGNDEYTRAHGSFGLSTLRNRHAQVGREELRLEFRGKSGVVHRLRLSDRRVASVVRRCQELPGERLFQYVDEGGRRRSVTSTEVNRYLREIGRGDWSSKAFRTWHGSVQALAALRAARGETDAAARARTVVRVIDEVARELGNTRAVSRKHYVDPRIVESYLAGELGEPAPARGPSGLSVKERDLLGFLERVTRSDQRPLRAAA